MWIKYLADNFNAVRENAAAALASASKVFKDKVLKIALGKIEEFLPMAKNQPHEDHDIHEEKGEFHSHLPKGAHIKQVANLNDLINMNAPLASKLEKSGGEIDYGVEKPAEPWEYTDGAIHLLNEISMIYPEEIIKYLPLLGEISQLKHFHHAICLRESIHSYLVEIFKRIGKPKFKANVEYFYDGIFDSLKSEKKAAVDIATDCLIGIEKLLGPSILKGRLEAYKPEYAEKYCLLIQKKPIPK